MSYNSINDLPKTVRNLPRHAKTLYMKAYNIAWEEYASPEEGDCTAREKAAHEAAWAAVKEEYEKDETGEWVKIGESDSRHPTRHRQRKMNSNRASPGRREGAPA